MSWDDELDLDAVHLEQPPSTNAPTSTRHQEPHTDDVDADVLGVDDEVSIKPRRVQVTLDEDKLMHPVHGISYLQSRAPTKLLPRIGKNRQSSKKETAGELKDLSKILQFYQLWAHKLYPKANFSDFIGLARSVGQRKRMRVWRRSWIDDEKGKKHNVDASHEDDGRNHGDTEANAAVRDSRVPEETRDDPESLFLGSNNDLDDTLPDAAPPSSSRRRANHLFSDDDDDEGLYDKPAPAPALSTTRDQIPDESELDELMGLSAPPPPTATEDRIPDENDLDELMGLSNSTTRNQTVSQVPGDDELDGIFADDDVDNLESASSITAAVSATASKSGPSEETIEDFEQEAFESVQDLGF